MKAFLFIINIVAFMGVLLWFIFEPSWESGSSCGIAFAALISQFFLNDAVKKIVKKGKTVSHNNSQNKIDNMSQTAGDNSSQYQSGGNMTINK